MSSGDSRHSDPCQLKPFARGLPGTKPYQILSDTALWDFLFYCGRFVNVEREF